MIDVSKPMIEAWVTSDSSGEKKVIITGEGNSKLPPYTSKIKTNLLIFEYIGKTSFFP
jgi:hypothetical protein